MSDLVRTLIIGLVTSVILLILVWIFWKIYDRPSKRQLEVEQERQEKSKEIRMWRSVEAQMAQEEAEAEALALIERKKAEQRARAIPPPTGVVTNAFAKLDAPTGGEQFNEQFKPKQELEQIQVEDLIEEAEQDDSDVLLAPELVEVRQDLGEDADHLLELLEQEDEVEQEEIELEVVESETLEQINQVIENEDEKSIADDKVEWDSKSEKDEDDPWRVGW